MFFGTRDSFEYFICNACHSLSITKEEKNIEKYYHSFQGFLDKRPELGYLKSIFLKYLFNFQNSLLNKFFKPFLTSYEDLAYKALIGQGISYKDKVLDVGCGSGNFVKGLKKIGFVDIIGIDPYLEVEKVVPGLKLLRKDIYEINGQFKLITFNHSFEHLNNGKKALLHAEKLLDNHGTIIIRLPNIESFSFKKFNSNWEGIHAPFHLFLPSKLGMEKMLSGTNLKIAAIEYEQLLHFFLNSQAYEKNIAAMEPRGVMTHYMKNSMKTYPPIFTETDIKHWKKVVKQVIKNKTSDYIIYYLKKY
jgi:2-polyprenyl-3-methyl-5-hydroxy-6-metoxy-1,4-benzoquinol methylase